MRRHRAAVVDDEHHGTVTHYDLLGVPPTAPTSEVRRAYVALARELHPDRVGGDAEAMRALNDAWATLRDPERRERYDRTLRARGPGPRPDGPPAPEHREVDDLLRELDDDTPLGGQIVLPRWFSLVPVGAFAGSIALLVGGALFGSAPALSLSVLLFVVSCALFLMAPFVALLASRRGR